MRRWTIYLIAMVSVISLLTTMVAGCASVSTKEPTPAATELPTALQTEEGKMIHQKVQLTTKQADGYIIPLGSVNIVCVVTNVGMVGCGAFDVMALDAFAYPAVRVKSSSKNPIATIDELLAGVVKDANAEATKLGIKLGMSGSEALDRL